MTQITTVLWSNYTAEEQAEFYTSLVPDGRILSTQRTPADTPSQQKGDVIVVEFELGGQRFSLLNGGPLFTHSEAVSFMIPTRDQEETDRLWNAIVGNGGQESQCGWCKDRWGLSWQITPRVLTEAMAQGGETARRAFEAMMEMGKIDVAAIEAAVRGETAPA